ncbi:unnamed protein product, partial [Staurois parvus]
MGEVGAHSRDSSNTGGRCAQQGQFRTWVVYARQQAASREVGDLWTLGSRLLPGTLTAAGSSRGLAISSRGPHGSWLLQGPSDQKAGALTAAGFSRGPV